MTTRELNNMIASVGLPYAYYQFPDNTEIAPPVICFYFPNDRNFYADNSAYVRAEELVVELYTPEKRFDLEEKLEAVLRSHGLAYTREEKYYDSERLIVEVYRSVVMLNKVSGNETSENESGLTEGD